jgi:hypothetical protein
MDYVRLKNVEVGYTLNTPGMRNASIQGIRFYVNGTNLLTFSGEKLIDPELTSGTAYPLQRIVNLGVTLTF